MKEELRTHCADRKSLVPLQICILKRSRPLSVAFVPFVMLSHIRVVMKQTLFLARSLATSLSRNWLIVVCQQSRKKENTGNKINAVVRWGSRRGGEQSHSISTGSFTHMNLCT